MIATLHLPLLIKGCDIHLSFFLLKGVSLWMDSSKDKEKKSLKSYPIDTLSQLNWRKGIKKLVQRNIKRIYIFLLSPNYINTAEKYIRLTLFYIINNMITWLCASHHKKYDIIILIIQYYLILITWLNIQFQENMFCILILVVAL